MSHATQLHNRGYLADYMQIMNRCTLPNNVQDEVYRQVHDRALATVKWTLEQALEEEVTIYRGCARYARRRQGRRPEETRSGAYRRELWTQYGCIPGDCLKTGLEACWQVDTFSRHLAGAQLPQDNMITSV